MLKLKEKQEIITQKENIILPKNGIFATWKKYKDGSKPTQKTYFMGQRDYILGQCIGFEDLYISQCIFKERNRRKINFKFASHAWVDLDFYKLEDSKYLSVSQILIKLEYFIKDNNIPLPSVIEYSGNGMYLKWFFNDIIGKKEGYRLEELNKKLTSFFMEFNADTGVYDLSRVLRSLGTINTKTGNTSEILRDNNIYYDFETLIDEVFDNEDIPEEPEQPKKGVKGPYKAGKGRKAAEVHSIKQKRTQRYYQANKAFNIKSYCYAVLCDIEAIKEMRFPDSPIPEKEGQDLFTFLGACMLAYVYADDPTTDIKAESFMWASKIVGHKFLNEEFVHYVSSLLQRVGEHRAGKRVIFKNKEYSPIYLYKKNTLIDLLKINSEEMKFLNVLIDDTEKQKRRYKQTREEYLQENNVSQTKPWEALGISRRTYYNYKKAGKI